MKLTKHVGLDTASNARISLIMTKLPDSDDCLVTFTDTLPADLKDAFYHVLNSDEGQRETNLAEALSRRLYSDSGTSILQTLHVNKYIKKVSIDSITMTPSPAFKIPLRDVLVQSGLMKESIGPDVEKFNPHSYNANAANVGEATGTAQNLLIEADLLMQAADQKRVEAYRIAPSLRPGYVTPAPESIDFPNNPALATKETVIASAVSAPSSESTILSNGPGTIAP